MEVSMLLHVVRIIAGWLYPSTGNCDNQTCHRCYPQLRGSAPAKSSVPVWGLINRAEGVKRTLYILGVE